MNAKQSIRGISGPGSSLTVWPVLLAAFFAALTSALLLRSGGLKIYLDRPELGSFLLFGLPNNDITFNMPLFGTAVALAQDLRAALPVLLAVRFGIYWLVFACGCLFRGFRSGLLALAAAGALELSGAFGYDAEQSFYSLFLLLAFALLLLRRRENTVRTSILTGLAIGASLLVRTPLFLFPPVVLLCDWVYSEERSRAFFMRSAAFLCASYVLLLPWGALNYSVSGKFSLLDSRRAACNLITSMATN